MLGYILLGFTLVFYIGLVSINISEPRTSGEAGMGYGLALAALGLGFTICSLILTINVANKGGLDWVLSAGASRNVLIGIGWLSLAIATFACAVFKWEWHEGAFPKFLHWVAVHHGQIWLPLLMLVPYFFLLNAQTRASISPNVYKIPLIIGFAVSVIMSLTLLFTWFKTTVQEEAAQMEIAQTKDKIRHADDLTLIAEQKPMDPLVNILSYTARFHDADVRSAALAKVKEKPDWEAQLLQLFENDYYCSHAYTFIEGNKVEHPEKYLEPINRSILRIAAKIPDEIKESNNLQHWTFEGYHIERLLRALTHNF